MFCPFASRSYTEVDECDELIWRNGDIWVLLYSKDTGMNPLYIMDVEDCHSSAMNRPQRIYTVEKYCEGPSSSITTITLASTDTVIVRYSL